MYFTWQLKHQDILVVSSFSALCSLKQRHKDTKCGFAVAWRFEMWLALCWPSPSWFCAAHGCAWLRRQDGEVLDHMFLRFFWYRSRLFTVYQNIVCLTSASDLFVKSSKLSVSRLHKGTPSWLWLPAGSGITMASLSGQSILAALVICGGW